MANSKSKSTRNVLAIMLTLIMLFSVMAPASYADETLAPETNGQEQTELVKNSEADNKVSTKTAIETDTSKKDGEKQKDSSDTTEDDDAMLTDDGNQKPTDDSNASTSSAVETAPVEDQTKQLEIAPEKKQPKQPEVVPEKEQPKQLETVLEAGIPPAKESIYWTDNLTEKPEGFTIDENNPDNITISSAEGLAWLAVLTCGANGNEADNFKGKTIILTENIDLSGKFWTPIGRYRRRSDFAAFQGTFDGGDHIISGLKMTTFTEDIENRRYGLFGFVVEGTIKNIHLSNVVVDTEKSSVGTLGGEVRDSFIENCTVTGNLNSTSNIAGLIYKSSGSDILKCAFSGSISSEKSAYGITNSCDSIIDQCYINATLKAGTKATAICGNLEGEPNAVATVSNCYAEGSIDTTGNTDIGGICGCVDSDASVKNCYSKMTVKGGHRIGGIVGHVGSNESSVKGCIALNEIITADGSSGNSGKGSSAGRVIGYKNNVDGAEIKKNFAYSGMKVYSKDDAGQGEILRLIGLPDEERMRSQKQGEDITAKDIEEGWPVVDWNENMWSFETGKLPTLKNISDKIITQTRTIPDYINVDSENDWNITAFDELTNTPPAIALGASKEDAVALLPTKIFGTKDGETAISIPEVTWNSDDYNGNEVGEYTFTAVLPEVGYEASVDLITAKVNVVLKYKVSFDTNGADEIEALSIDNESLITKPSDPTRDGFIFEGWYKDEARTEAWNFDADTVASAMTLYAKWSIDGDADYTATESAEQQDVDVSGMGLENAIVAHISNIDGYITYAVVVDQKIDFYAPAGDYIIVDSGETVESLINTLMSVGVEIRQLAGNRPEELCYKGRGRGTVDEPLTIIANFFAEDASELTETVDTVGLTFRILSEIAGYDPNGRTNYGTPYYMTVEDRDESAGRLEASFTIDGSKLQPCYEWGWFRSPREYGIALNPSDELIKGRFKNPESVHTLYYSEKYSERFESAFKRLKAVRDDDKKVLMMHTQARDFPGPVTFKLDVSNYFDNGDKVNINYLLGAANPDLYHAFECDEALDENYMLAFEPTYIKNNTFATVEDGYITFDLYNGGYFELVKQENDTPRTKYAVEFITNKDVDGELYPSTVYPQMVESGNKADKPDDPTKEDYTFGGWYTDKEKTKPFDFNIAITDDVMLYAKWTSDSGPGGDPGTVVGKTYKVEFVTGKTSSGDKAAKIPFQEIEEGKKAKDPAKDSKTCPFGFYDRGDGYLVLDWYTDSNLKNKFRFSNAITKDTKLYPKYQRYILKDDGRGDSGKGSKNNPYKVKLGDTKQSKIAWKFFNELARGKLSGYYKVYVEKKNDGDELFSWSFNGDDFKKCDTAQPYYVYISTHKVGNTLELEMANRTAIEGKVKISVDVSKYIKKDCEVDVEYKDGSCDGMVAHSNFESDNWVQSHHKPKACFTNKMANVEDGYVTFDINHGGTYIIKSDQIKADDSTTTGTTGEDKKTAEKVKAGEKINASKLNQIIKDKKLLLITSEQGEILFDSKALQTLKKEIMGTLKVDIDLIKNVKLTEKQKEKVAKKIENRPVYDLKVKTGNKNISTFGGGKVTVTLPYTLRTTEKSSGLVMWHLNDNGELIDIPCTYDAKKKEVTFKTTHFSYYVVGYDKNLEWDNPFGDVKEKDWFYRAIAYVNKNGLMGGISKDKFMPNGKTTRAMLVTILYRKEGSPKAGSPKADNNVTFKDVKKSTWYTDAVSWAVQNNIVNGYNDATFGTNDPITREQLVAILYRYEKAKNANVNQKGQITGFKDSNLVSSWASDGIKWAVGEKVLNGKGNNNLDPTGKATRAEVATVVQKIIEIEVGKINI